MNSIIISHIGKRESNQDFVLVENINSDTQLHIVADGMGGYENGEIAASLVAENILTYLSTVQNIDSIQIQKAINKANLVIRQEKDKRGAKLGATVGGIVYHSNQAICFWVGDVKIFHFKNKKLIKESTSHTLIEEIIKNGSIKDSKQINKYKHVVTRSVQGDVEHSKIEYFKVDNIDHSDLFMICSDGVHDIYEGLVIQNLLNSNDTLEKTVSQIESSLKFEAKDNFSLIALSKHL